MLQTGYIIDERFVNHRPPDGHPERPARIETLIEVMNAYRREGVVRLEPRLATEEELLLNHDGALVEQVRMTTGRGAFAFDADTYASSDTYETACLAAGGLLAMVDAVVSGEVDNGFVLVRPPGHHAEADRAMGFCFFNNVAIAARYLLKKDGVERVLIMDFDVHHGNGTQRSFYAVDDVMYISTHQFPFYPGTGAAEEIGVADGIGFNVNVPFPAGFGDDEHVAAFKHVIDPVARQFDPDFVLISAGFDAHHTDPLAEMRVTGAGFAAMTRMLLSIAMDHAQGRCAAVLEGGYSLDGLRESVPAVFDALGGTNLAHEPVRAGAEETVAAVQRIHKRFWKF